MGDSEQMNRRFGSQFVPDLVALAGATALLPLSNEPVSGRFTTPVPGWRSAA